MIEIKDLVVGVENKDILQGISMKFELGKNYCLLGKNWSGKSTLSSFLMGHPKYKHVSGTVSIEDKNLIELSPEKRSEMWLFLSFQNVPEIKGIKLSEYLRTIYNIHLKQSKSDVKDLSPFLFKRFITKHINHLHIDAAFLDRDLNVWFSWGEKRKIEILQMNLIWPKYIILDEIDSGLDLDAFRAIAELLQVLSSEKNTLIIITHYFKILEYVDVDKVYVLKGGKVVKEGGAELAKEVSQSGFSEF
jgi:Fe-S cluster assembly ATP-binding protein